MKKDLPTASTNTNQKSIVAAWWPDECCGVWNAPVTDTEGPMKNHIYGLDGATVGFHGPMEKSFDPKNIMISRITSGPKNMKIRDISITVRTLGQQSCYLTVTLVAEVVVKFG